MDHPSRKVNKLSGTPLIDLGAMIATVSIIVVGGFIGTTVLSIAVEWMRTGLLIQSVSRGGMVLFWALFAGFAGLWVGCRLFYLSRIALQFSRTKF